MQLQMEDRLRDGKPEGSIEGRELAEEGDVEVGMPLGDKFSATTGRLPMLACERRIWLLVKRKPQTCTGSTSGQFLSTKMSPKGFSSPCLLTCRRTNSCPGVSETLQYSSREIQQ